MAKISFAQLTACCTLILAMGCATTPSTPSSEAVKASLPKHQSLTIKAYSSEGTFRPAARGWGPEEHTLEPLTASCTATNEKGSWVTTTPGPVEVLTDGGTLAIACNAEGYRTATARLTCISPAARGAMGGLWVAGQLGSSAAPAAAAAGPAGALALLGVLAASAAVGAAVGHATAEPDAGSCNYGPSIVTLYLSRDSSSTVPPQARGGKAADTPQVFAGAETGAPVFDVDVGQRLAVLLASGEGAMSYQYREPTTSQPTLVQLVKCENRLALQCFSDRSEYRDLRELVAFQKLSFDPPIPLATPGLEVGARWSYSGIAKARDGPHSARVDSEFHVVAREERDIPAGRFRVFRVEEKRSIQGALMHLTHWVDVETLAVVASSATTPLRGSHAFSHNAVDPPEYDYSLQLLSVR